MATFADMATLLMAFVLLLSFAEVEVVKFKQVAGSLSVWNRANRAANSNTSWSDLSD